MGLAPPVQLQAVHASTRQASRQGTRFGSMTNPTDTGGENPTIRDVSPPSDTESWTLYWRRSAPTSSNRRLLSLEAMAAPDAERLRRSSAHPKSLEALKPTSP